MSPSLKGIYLGRILIYPSICLRLHSAGTADPAARAGLAAVAASLLSRLGYVADSCAVLDGSTEHGLQKWPVVVFRFRSS